MLCFHPGHRLLLVALALGQGLFLAGAEEAKVAISFPEDEVSPEFVTILGKLKVFNPNSTTGIVMYSEADEDKWAQFTIPLWRQYAKKHKYDFYLERRRMVRRECAPEWSEALLLRAIFAKYQQWETVWLVRSNSLPMSFNKPLKQFVKSHMNKKRWDVDPWDKRAIFCSLDCPEHDSKDSDCDSIHMSGCIFRRRPRLMKYLEKWFMHIKKPKTDCAEASSVAEGLIQARQGLFEVMFLHNSKREIGEEDSTWVATFYATKSSEVPGKIRDAIRANKVLSEAMRRADKEGDLEL